MCIEFAGWCAVMLHIAAANFYISVAIECMMQDGYVILLVTNNFSFEFIRVA